MEEWNFERIIKVLKNNWILIVLLFCCGTIIGYVQNAILTVPEFSSTTSVIIANTQSYDIEENNEENNEEKNEIEKNKKRVSLDNDTCKQIIMSETVLGKVIDNLKLEMSYTELCKKVNVYQSDKSTVIKISVSNSNAKLASEISEEIANVFLERLFAMYEKNDTRILDKPNISTVPSNISPKKYAAIGGAIGLVIALFVAIAKEVLNKNIKNDYDVENRLKIPVLASIGKNKYEDKLVALDKASIYGESFRVLISNMKYLKNKAILVTSNTSGEGKSWVSANLAITYAKSGKKTLLIDSDMRRGRQDKIFKIKNKHGLSDLIKFEHKIEEIEFDKYKQNIFKNLDIITRGSSLFDYSRLLFTDVINKIITEAKEKYDYIIIDGTPNALVVDDMLLTKFVDSTLIVVKYDNTKINDIAKMRDRIVRAGGSICGIVMNEVPSLGKKYENAYYSYSENLPVNVRKSKKCIKNKNNSNIREN